MTRNVVASARAPVVVRVSIVASVGVVVLTLTAVAISSVGSGAPAPAADYPDAITRRLHRMAAEPRPVNRSAMPPRLGADAEKVAAVWKFESSTLFTDPDPERAALRLARDAAQVPNATTAAHVDELRRHFTETEILDLVAMISLFGFLNRWNETMATALEDEPRAFGHTHLTTQGWEPGKHDA